MWKQRKCSVFTMLHCRQCATSLLLAVFGAAISVAVFVAARSWELHSIRRDFDSLADDRFHVMESEFQDFAKLLAFADNVFMIAPGADSPGFTDYVRSLRTFLEKDQSRYPSLHGVTWVPRVPSAQRAAYERAARAAFDPRFQLGGAGSPAGTGPDVQRATCFPAYLCVGEPFGDGWPGRDLALDPAAWKTMTRACDTGTPIAMAPATMSGDANDRLGYRVFQPLYRGGDPGDSVSRRQASAGFLCADLDVGKLAEKAFRDLQPVGIDVNVYDGSGASSVLVCRHTSRVQSPGTGRGGEDLGGQLAADCTTESFGRKLSLRCLSTDGFWAGRAIWQPWVLLCSGLALTLLGAGYHLTLALRAASIERAVSSRLSALLREVGQQQANRRQEPRLPTVEPAGDELGQAVGAACANCFGSAEVPEGHEITTGQQ
jgi:hypothetical protein